MPKMQWTEAMSVGLPELDADHRELIRIINLLDEAPESEGRNETLRQALVALQRYAEYHFAREEKVMAVCGYPNIEEHKAEHRAFVRQLGTFNQQFTEDSAGAAQVVHTKLRRYLQDWLKHHILVEDMAYKPTVEKDPRARRAARDFAATEIWWSS